MRLLLPSFLIAAYTFTSLILPLPVRLWQKAVLGFVALGVSMKYLGYHYFGGAFFRPELPDPVLIIAEALYAALLLLCFFALLKDAAAFLLWLSRRLGTGWHLPLTSTMRASLFTVLALAAGAWGTFQAVRVPDVKTVEITIPDLPPHLEGFTLVQLTDIHIGPLLKRTWLEAVVDKTSALAPDAVVITGDVIDGLPSELAQEVQPLAKLRARFGVFGVNGNHEYYYDAAGWQPVFRALGIDMLCNEHRVLPGGLVLGGVTDRTATRFGLPGPDVSRAFAGAPAGPRILLSHQPQFADMIPSDDVAPQLSGHTHGGLMFFLAPLIAHYNNGWVKGLYRSGKGQLYVSPGTGLWSGFSCRLGVPSEITRIILRRS
jgi:predicted MPP superfamily phosphohydrolase